MKVEWTHVLTATISFILGLIIKTLLDFNLAKGFVKYFYWLPVRFVFRQKPPQISGDWEEIWDFESSPSYSKLTERHGYTALKQLGKYCYGEFYSRDEKYFIFGTITDNYITGKWGDCNDKLGYYGSFQLRIINSKSMDGKWIGHSKSTQDIFGDKWTWTKKS